jgi:hypothetical protein
VREDHEPAPPAPALPRPRMCGIHLELHYSTNRPMRSQRTQRSGPSHDQ